MAQPSSAFHQHFRADGLAVDGAIMHRCIEVIGNGILLPDAQYYFLFGHSIVQIYHVGIFVNAGSNRKTVNISARVGIRRQTGCDHVSLKQPVSVITNLGATSDKLLTGRGLRLELTTKNRNEIRGWVRLRLELRHGCRLPGRSFFVQLHQREDSRNDGGGHYASKPYPGCCARFGFHGFSPLSFFIPAHTNPWLDALDSQLHQDHRQFAQKLTARE